MKAKHTKQGSKGGTKKGGMSASQNTSVGSGSRPGTKSRHTIETSAPADAKLIRGQISDRLK